MRNGEGVLSSLQNTTTLCRLLGDQTRVRLLSLLSEDELTVAELTNITQLPQPRISTHLRKLREADFVRDRRSGGSSFYGLNDESWPTENGQMLKAMLASTNDPLLTSDRVRAREVIASRGQNWAESVAGKMARHYSPGRTWPALIQGLIGLTRFESVIDIASGDSAAAELLADRTDQVTCVDISARVVQTNRERLSSLENVRFVQGDMHALPFEDGQFQHALLLSSLAYTRSPLQVLAEASRVLADGGQLAAVALRKHPHAAIVQSYGHLNDGFEPEELRALAEEVGLVVAHCALTGRERRPPHFETITLYAARAPRVAGSGASP
jgi:SAM-dependent methyltransferase